MSDPFVGEIRMFGFSRVPEGWQACDGSLLSISTYQILYMLLGTTYGGDGVNTFGVPDMRGRVPVQQHQGPGLSNRFLGEKNGTETVTLISSQLPIHSHACMATTDAGTTPTPGAALTFGGIAPDTMYTPNITGLTAYTLSAGTVGAQGGSQPHNNLMPTLSVAFCIATTGIFPQQQ